MYGVTTPAPWWEAMPPGLHGECNVTDPRLGGWMDHHGIKESIYIIMLCPDLNADGRHHLPPTPRTFWRFLATLGHRICGVWTSVPTIDKGNVIFQKPLQSCISSCHSNMDIACQLYWFDTIGVWYLGYMWRKKPSMIDLYYFDKTLVKIIICKWICKNHDVFNCKKHTQDWPCNLQC